MKLLPRRLVLVAMHFLPRVPWQEAAGFSRLWRDVRRKTLLDPPRAQTLYQLARNAAVLDGSFAEIGVYRGGTAKLLAHVADEHGRKLHLFDTFEGMPSVDADHDRHAKGDFARTSLASVQAFVSRHASPVFHPGFFPETAAPVKDETFSLVHVDVDIAPSVEACCEFFYPRMVPGGVMVFDDYGFTSCPGAKLATDAFFERKPEPVLHLVTSQAVVFKHAPS
jgi:O-methyltransferase